MDAAALRLAEALNDALPQTQCTRCGYPDCRSYAEAMAADTAPINQCPPGGAAGIDRLARITGRRAEPLNPAHGSEAPRRIAAVDEAWCIGCTLCLKACPVDCIVGAPKLMHTVVPAQCTGCELCIPACPVDCIVLLPASGERTGWAAWSAADAAKARDRYRERQLRLAREQADAGDRLGATTAAAASGPAAPSSDDRKSAAIQAALARARAARPV